MRVNTQGLREYMINNGVDKVAVEVVDVNVPKAHYSKPRVLAKRLVITKAAATAQWSHISYAMYNSFKRSECYVPNDFQFDILPQAAQMLILNEYQEHRDGLEKSFRDAFNDVHDTIQEKLAAAKVLVKEAEKLSTESGVPFNAPYDLFQRDASFYPRSFEQKFGDNPDVREVMMELTELHDDSDFGWSRNWDSSSANC